MASVEKSSIDPMADLGPVPEFVLTDGLVPAQSDGRHDGDLLHAETLAAEEQLLGAQPPSEASSTPQHEASTPHDELVDWLLARLNEQRERAEAAEQEAAQLRLERDTALVRVDSLTRAVVDFEWDSDVSAEEAERQQQEWMADRQEAFDLRHQIEELREQLSTDELTGLSSRRAVVPALERASQDESIDVVALDVNMFGVPNKLLEFGEPEGDRELQRISRCLVVAAEEFGVSPRNVFRKGGDELVILAPKTRVQFVGAPEHGAIVSTGRRKVPADVSRGILGGSAENFVIDPEAPRVNYGEIPTGEAILQRAKELYGHTVYVGTYGQKGLRSAIVSVSGVVGDTFHDTQVGYKVQSGSGEIAVPGLQVFKQLDKSQYWAKHPEVAHFQFRDEDKNP